MGLAIRGWRLVGLVVELGGVYGSGMEIGRFRGGDGWVYGSVGGDW